MTSLSTGIVNMFTEKMCEYICTHICASQKEDVLWLRRTVLQQEHGRPLSTWVSHPDIAHTTQEPLALLMHYGEALKL